VKTLVLVEAATPIVLAATIAAMGRWPVVRYGVKLALLLLALLATVLAVTTPGVQISLGATPWDSQVGLDFSAPASWLVAMVFWSVALAYLPHRHMPLADGPPVRLGLALGLQGAIGVALLVNDLLTRVVALDLISVLVALLLLFPPPFRRARPAAIWHYIVLCVGDMSFLLVALLLYALTGAMGIAAAFDGIAAMSPGQLALLAAAGLLAIWVKSGLAPFAGWLRAAMHLPAPERALVLSAGPPLMAAYLLYRLQPAFDALGSVGALALWGGAAVVAAVALAPVRRQGAGRSAIERALTLHSALGLAAGPAGLLAPYLLTFVPMRAALCLAIREPAPADDGIYVDLGLPLPRAVAVAMAGAARIELALEGLIASLGSAPHRVGALLQRAHTGRLRRNLLWAVVALAPVLLAMLSALVTAP